MWRTIRQHSALFGADRRGKQRRCSFGLVDLRWSGRDDDLPVGPLVLVQLLPVLPCPHRDHHPGGLVHGERRLSTCRCVTTSRNDDPCLRGFMMRLLIWEGFRWIEGVCVSERSSRRIHWPSVCPLRSGCGQLFDTFPMSCRVVVGQNEKQKISAFIRVRIRLSSVLLAGMNTLLE